MKLIALLVIAAGINGYSCILFLTHQNSYEFQAREAEVLNSLQKVLSVDSIEVSVIQADSLPPDALSPVLKEDSTRYFCRLEFAEMDKNTRITLIIRHSAGRIQDSLVAQGFFPQAKAALVLKAKSYFSKSQLGNIILSTLPDKARISIDGKRIGTSPVEMPLCPGSHRLLLEKSGFGDIDQELFIKSGEEIDLKYRLLKDGRKYSSTVLFRVCLGLTAAAFASQVANDYYHDRYSDLAPGSSPKQFDQAFTEYRAANAGRNILMASTVALWGLFIWKSK